METERIIMGEELDDMHINLAVRLLITQFPDLSCLKSTLLQQMSVLEKKSKMLQIIHCSSCHNWVVATNIKSKTEGCVMMYDSTFKNVDSETREVIDGMFSQLPVAKVKVAKSQKKKGKKTVVCLPLHMQLHWHMDTICQSELLPRVHAIPFGQLQRRTCTLSLRAIHTIVH